MGKVEWYVKNKGERRGRRGWDPILFPISPHLSAPFHGIYAILRTSSLPFTLSQAFFPIT